MTGIGADEIPTKTYDTVDDGYDFDGVDVEKSTKTNEDGILQIEFAVHSSRTDPVHVTIRDPLPEDFPLDRVGFHADYGRENWAMTDDRVVVFETDLEPQGDLRTIYAVKHDGVAEESAFSTDTEVDIEPDVDRPKAATNGDESMSNGTDDGDGRDESIEESESGPDGDLDIPTLDELEAGDHERPVRAGGDAISPDDEGGSGTLQLSDPVETTETDDVGATSGSMETGDDAGESGDDDHPDEAGGFVGSPPPAPDGPIPETGATASDVAEEGLVARLAAELESGSATDDEIETLEQHFGTGDLDHERTRLEVRLRSAERDLTELRAYKGALEEFIDEKGTGRELVSKLERQYEEITSRLDSISSEQSTIQSRLEAVEAQESRIDELDDRFGDTTERIDSLSGGLDDLRDRQDDSDDWIESLDDDLEALRTSHEESDERIDALDDGLDDLADRLDESDDRVDSLDDGLDDLRSRLDASDERFESLDDDVDDLRERQDESDERIDTLDDGLDDLAVRLDESDDRIERNRETIDAVDDRLDAVEAEYVSDTEALEETIETVADEVDEIRTWHRKFGRLLNDFAMFSPQEMADSGEEASGDDASDPDDESSVDDETDSA